MTSLSKDIIVIFLDGYLYVIDHRMDVVLALVLPTSLLHLSAHNLVQKNLGGEVLVFLDLNQT